MKDTYITYTITILNRKYMYIRFFLFIIVILFVVGQFILVSPGSRFLLN